MSNFLSVATVTATLRRFLQGVVSADVNGATVTMVRPTESGAGLPQTGVNVFLYEVSANPELRNFDLPTRRADGSGVQRPAAAVDLHYLFSFYGDQSTLEPQRLLGSVVRTLHARPILTRAMIRDTVADPAFGFLAGSDLDAEGDLVRFVPLNFGLQELSQLWTGMFQKSEYALSVAYRASMVLLTADESTAPSLPVREWRLLVETLRQPVITSVDTASGEPLVLGATVRLRGERLQGVQRTRVRLAGQEIEPTEVSDTEIRFPLASPTVDVGPLRAGVQAVQVLHPFLAGDPPEPRAGVESNVAPLVLRPHVSSAETGRVSIQSSLASATLTLTWEPLVGARQKAFVLLNTVAGSPQPAAYSFPVPPRTDDAEDSNIAITGVLPAVYLVRLQVDGAESPLDVDSDPESPTFGTFTGPTIDLTAGIPGRGGIR
ncbi:MAG TPA: Pvc16 family protein [Thermoanaerobaculia bacterium]|nr:Pvc16 family protein [Thermoanaerobaculia bacterium]